MLAVRRQIVRSVARAQTSVMRVVHEKRWCSAPPRATQTAAVRDRRQAPRTKRTILDLNRKYRNNEPLVMITCYDYPTAAIVEDVGVDLVLIGDSAGMVVHGHETTIPVTIEDIISHCQAVRRGAPNSFLIGDMPFGSFEANPQTAIESALRIVKAGHVDAVKLEGGARMGDAVSAICSTGVLVQGHIGLTPQTSAAMGGFRVQGKSVEAAKTLLEDAKALQKAGCFSIVIEGVPPQVAQYITQQLDIPTIGIGAGSHTSGQVLVLHDMIGLNPGRTPKFCKKYADVSSVIHQAVGDYCSDVRDGSFPGPDYSYSMPAEEAEKMVDVLSREVSFRSL